jgi:hypothetical protein
MICRDQSVLSLWIRALIRRIFGAKNCEPGERLKSIDVPTLIFKAVERSGL